MTHLFLITAEYEKKHMQIRAKCSTNWVAYFELLICSPLKNDLTSYLHVFHIHIQIYMHILCVCMYVFQWFDLSYLHTENPVKGKGKNRCRKVQKIDVVRFFHGFISCVAHIKGLSGLTQSAVVGSSVCVVDFLFRIFPSSIVELCWFVYTSQLYTAQNNKN